MRRILIIPAAAILTGLALTGCTTQLGADSSSAPSGISQQESAPQAADGGAIQSFDGDQKGDTVSGNRQVITTGYVTITVERPMDAATDAIRIIEKSGGRVDGRTETAPVNGNKGSATLTLRIPSQKLTATLDELRELGAIQEVSLNAVDVTMDVQDLDSRITALSASVDRLLGLLATATDTENLITLETAISDRQGELESLKSQQRYYADQVSMSTVTLNLVSDFTAPVAEPDTFLSGLAAGWTALIAFFAGLLVLLGVLLPWLVLLAIIAAVIVLIVRRAKRSEAHRSHARSGEAVSTETRRADAQPEAAAPAVDATPTEE